MFLFKGIFGLNMSIVNRALTYFFEFDYQNEMVKQIYRRDYNAFKLIFDNESSETGAAYKIRKDDYRQMNFLTVILDDAFYDFYLANIKNKNLINIDLRIYYHLNKNEDIKYKCKIGGRDTKIMFSKTNICSAFTYPDRTRQNIKVACINDAFTNKDGKYYCLDHIPN